MEITETIEFRSCQQKPIFIFYIDVATNLRAEAGRTKLQETILNNRLVVCMENDGQPEIKKTYKGSNEP